jgi:hypothetical protein
VKARAGEEGGDAPPAHGGKEPLELGDHGGDEVGELADRDAGVHERLGSILLEPSAPTGDGVVGDQEATAGLGLRPAAGDPMSCRMAMRSVGG